MIFSQHVCNRSRTRIRNMVLSYAAVYIAIRTETQTCKIAAVSNECADNLLRAFVAEVALPYRKNRAAN